MNPFQTPLKTPGLCGGCKKDRNLFLLPNGQGLKLCGDCILELMSRRQRKFDKPGTADMAPPKFLGSLLNRNLVARAGAGLGAIRKLFGPKG